MKPFPVVYLKRAQNDLEEILAYIERDRPEAAARWIETLDKRLGRLARYPNSGCIPKDDRLAGQGFRLLVFGDYLAFYRIRSRRVEIVRVLHGSRRWSFLLP
ncbi:MAG: type II toxin-antitoxin system mRNA interferase toxin, RelE/StbE family [Elusimicrobia bacterium CG_4_9_14_3_um_filter_62_55]|nr:MAG: type II toxin-antitoxin system mRNA interferase toxin, RelE/StbE family [Elusimicrobia bacterium CG22_combo_CG10-13_8_21_14_all_63_91]PJA11759.1 MAG: type II toxin-antitoxin system mRNA interferase toxin, RelE/StbE family [Elusimicrobia bacterium CG_4_10_14_0_2_um_filter_63_34]PJB24130.1 MAG: type II toxin-antitoxin system mRNA interferase toxin, RelE/StbE family [Elusimicrobia bacterium CG_4_9_14_3_um_filter_62_55]